MRTSFIIASGILVGGTLLSGQNSVTKKGDNAPSAMGLEAKPKKFVSGFQITSKTKDSEALGFYWIDVLEKIRSNWYSQIPSLENSVGLKQGVTLIDIEISKNGSLGKINTVGSSGDDSMDSVALGAITSSAPFAELPEAYREKALRIRMYFGYSQRATLEAPMCEGLNWGAHPTPFAVHQVGNGVAPPKAIHAPDPEFSEEARAGKNSSFVQVAGTVTPDGAFTDLCIAQAAGAGLDEKAIETVKTWKFEPATLNGEPVAVRINVEVSFRIY